MEGMLGMMGDEAPNLKTLTASRRSRTVMYSVATGDSKTRDFWERNLRFKTDVSAD
jgi:cytochrome c